MQSSSPVELTGGQILARLSASAGISHVYGVASGKLGPLLGALAAEPRLTYVGVRHEASAAMMATGHYAATGKLALCLGETGPGGLNLLSGLGGARANSLAVLAITSSNPQGLLAPDRGAFSTTSNPDLFRPLMKWSARAHATDRLPELFREALRAALTGAPGPVHIDVPADVLAGRALVSPEVLDVGLQASVPAGRPVPEVAQIDAILAQLESAQRPLLIGGGGAVSSDGGKAFRSLAELIGVPVLVTQMGLGLLPTGHPLLIGQGGAISGPAACKALEEADVIVAVGCRFSSWMWPSGPPQWSRSDQWLAQIDIDPQMIGRNHRVHTGVVADAAAACTVLARAAAERTWRPRTPWNDHLHDLARAHRATLEALAANDTLPMHPAALASRLGLLLGHRGLAVFDGGHTTFWCNDFTAVPGPRTRFHEPGMAHLGFGLPWAIAMRQVCHDGPVVCITGDGAVGFTIQELDTARRHNLPVIVIVHNNAALGVIAFGQRKAGFSFGAELGDTDYAAIARGFGCFGQVVDKLDELEEALAKAIASGLPALLDVRCRFEPHPMIGVFARSTSQPAGRSS